MKISDQSVPPDLRYAYDRLVSQASALESPPTSVRTRKAARIPPATRAKSIKTRARIYARTVEALAYSFGYVGDAADAAAFKEARLQELLDGVINLQYWRAVYPDDQAVYGAYPTSAPDPAPPPYLYRDQANMPTVATYGAGTLLAQTVDGDWEDTPPPLNYAGSTTGGYFHDDALTWYVMAFDMGQPLPPPDQYPILLEPHLNITATCDRRGSRPMFSYLWRLTAHAAAQDVAAQPTPPVSGVASALYRYKVPTGVAPYYSASMQRRDLLVPFRNAEQQGRQHLLLRLALRPMYGRAFNNNTAVGTTATNSARLYVPRVTPQPSRRPTFRTASTSVRMFSDNMQSSFLWDMSLCSRPNYDGVPNYADQLDAHIGGVVVSTNYAHIGTAFYPQAAYYSYANNEGVRVLGSTYNGALFTEGPFLDQQQNEFQAIYRTAYLNQSTLCAQGTPNQMAPFLAMRFVGGFQSGMIVNSLGDAYNYSFSSRTRPPIGPLASPALVWNNYCYMQDEAGQWWQFAAPPNNGGNWAAPIPGAPWPPLRKLGPPTLKPTRAWPCALGIMIPRPAGAQTTHYLLTWEGALREYDLVGAIDADYLGTV